jgi:hypothetical protein
MLMSSWLAKSHLTEFGLLRNQRTGAIALPEDAIDTPEPSDYGSIDHRRQSIPFRPTSDSRKVLDVGASIPSPPGTPSTPVTRSALRRQPPPGEQADTPRLVKRVHYDDTSDAESARLLDMTSSWKDDRTNTLLGLSFAACSGTLSGMSLLFAKCAVELLILTFASKGKQNQFKSFQSWILLVGLGVTALAQLYYLNYSLRLAGPAVICPLAFCFYNISSIFGTPIAVSLIVHVADFHLYASHRWAGILLPVLGARTAPNSPCHCRHCSVVNWRLVRVSHRTQDRRRRCPSWIMGG